jgi:hypothetical protein
MHMSAYIVRDQTINKVVTWLRREVYRRVDNILDQSAEKYQIDLSGDMWDEKLAQAMFTLNCAGVDARYGEGTAKQDVTIPFTYKPEYCLTLVEVFKALQCWLYQCSEGDIPETSKLYQFFSDVENYLARKIVMDLPAYQKELWG